MFLIWVCDVTVPVNLNSSLIFSHLGCLKLNDRVFMLEKLAIVVIFVPYPPVN